MQYAALPYRVRRDGEVQIRLITSRETRRWVIPKGWPMKGLSPPKTAAREAYEEAGLVGVVSREPLGLYTYEKRLGTRSVLCDVLVFPLKVKRLLEKWPERFQRYGFWFSIDSAAAAVQEEDLSELIRSFGEIMARRWAAKQLEAEQKGREKAASKEQPERAPPAAGQVEAPPAQAPAPQDTSQQDPSAKARPARQKPVKARPKAAAPVPDAVARSGVAAAEPAAAPDTGGKAKSDKGKATKAKPEKAEIEKAKLEKAKPGKAKPEKAKTGKAPKGRKVAEATGAEAHCVAADADAANAPGAKTAMKGKGGKAVGSGQDLTPPDTSSQGDTSREPPQTLPPAAEPFKALPRPRPIRKAAVVRKAEAGAKSVTKPAAKAAVRLPERKAAPAKKATSAKKVPAAKKAPAARKVTPAKMPAKGFKAPATGKRDAKTPAGPEKPGS
ncbi:MULTISPECIES: NUDIX hydrolase [Xanthobacter]|uniref:NUDIX hydrolase n=1 Tax=Xanthobacter TaxID=279 RepID=UPI0032BFED03